MENYQTKQETDESSPIEPFVDGPMMFRKKVYSLPGNICSVEDSFTVTNGLLGMKRNIFLRLCRVITSLPGMVRAMKDQLIPAMLGISQEQVAWKRHNHFAETRTHFIWPAASPAKDIADARVLVDKYDIFGSSPFRSVSTVVNDMLQMADIVGAYSSLFAVAEAPCLALSGLLGAARTHSSSSGKRNTLQRAVAASPLFALVRILVRTVKPAFYRRAGYVLIGVFYNNAWTREGVLLRRQEFMELIGVVSAYTRMVHAHTGLSNRHAVLSAEIEAGLASPFTKHKNLGLYKHDLLDGALEVLAQWCVQGEAGRQLWAESRASVAAALVGLLDVPDATASRKAAQCLIDIISRDVAADTLRRHLIAEGVLAVLEKRMGHESGLDLCNAQLSLCLCGRCAGDANGAVRNAVRASDVVAVTLAGLRRTSDGPAIGCAVQMLHTVLCTESADNGGQVKGGGDDGAGEEEASVSRCATIFRAAGAAEILPKALDSLVLGMAGKGGGVKEAVGMVSEILAQI